MNAQEFYLYFGASHVLICQLELKLWNHGTEVMKHGCYHLKLELLIKNSLTIILLEYVV